MNNRCLTENSVSDLNMCFMRQVERPSEPHWKDFQAWVYVGFRRAQQVHKVRWEVAANGLEDCRVNSGKGEVLPEFFADTRSVEVIFHVFLCHEQRSASINLQSGPGLDRSQTCRRRRPEETICSASVNYEPLPLLLLCDTETPT